MKTFDSILVATDFSATGNNAVRRAAWLARAQDARLDILHVIDSGRLYRVGKGFAPAVDLTSQSARAHAELGRIAGEMRSAFQVTAAVILKIGDPLDMLVRTSERASLVVLGQRTGGSLRDWVLGTPAGRPLDAGSCPVLVVKQNFEGPYRRVLTGLDFTPTSDAAARVATALAPSADLHFMHVFHSQHYAALLQTDTPSAILRALREREEAGVIARMRRRIAAIGLDSRRLHLAVARGSGTPAILPREHMQGADLVAVGRRRRVRWLDALLGSVSRRVLARAQGDVLVVPSLPESPAVLPASKVHRQAGLRADDPAPARRWSATTTGARAGVTNRYDHATAEPRWSTFLHQARLAGSQDRRP